MDVEGPDLDLALAHADGAQHLRVLGPVRSLDPVRALTGLRILELRSVRAGDLSVLRDLPDLVNLQLRLGSVTDITGLAQAPGLQYVELWWVRGLDDVRVLGRLPALASFFLQDQPRVTALPDLSASHELRAVGLDHMRGIHDLRPLSAAPALTEVSLVACDHMQPEEFAPLLRCGSLRRVNIGLGSDRKNRAVRDLLGIPGNYGGHTVR